jgi:hypothetical protein
VIVVVSGRVATTATEVVVSVIVVGEDEVGGTMEVVVGADVPPQPARSIATNAPPAAKRINAAPPEETPTNTDRRCLRVPSSGLTQLPRPAMTDSV